jgi:hypothetical protein
VTSGAEVAPAAGGSVSLADCALDLRTEPAEFAPGDSLLFAIGARCGEGAVLRGVTLELALAGDREVPLASAPDTELGDEPALLAAEGFAAEPGCYLLRASRGPERVELRRCTEAEGLTLPPAGRPGRAPADAEAGALAKCRFLALRALGRPVFQPGERLDFEAAMVCPEAVPRVEVTLHRDGRPDPANLVDQARGVPLLKGRSEVTLRGNGYRAASDCFRLEARRGRTRIEGRFCARPTRLRLADPLLPAPHASR